MDWNSMERLGQEHQAALLHEAEDIHRLQGRGPSLRPRLARWMRALADRLERVTPPPCPHPPCTHKAA